jgi:PAS domain S-box-containing protein
MSLFKFETSFFPGRSTEIDRMVSLPVYLLVGGAAAALVALLWNEILNPLFGFPHREPLGYTMLGAAVVGVFGGVAVYLHVRSTYLGALRRIDLLFKVVHSTDVGIWILDEQTRSVWHNPAVERIVRQKVQSGTPVANYLPPEAIGVVRQELVRRRAGLPGTYRLELPGSGGHVRTVEVVGSPIHDRTGRFQGSFGLFVDLTELLEEQEMATEEARRDTALALVARLHHKINNSLMIIRGQSEVRLRRTEDADLQQVFGQIVTQVDSITRELEALSEMKVVETSRYLPDRDMLTLPGDQESEPPGS